MDARFKVGQKVIIKPVSDNPSLRNDALEPYTGQTGEIVNYYWLSPRAGTFFYIYTVRIRAGHRVVVVHEDEIEPAGSGVSARGRG